MDLLSAGFDGHAPEETGGREVVEASAARPMDDVMGPAERHRQRRGAPVLRDDDDQGAIARSAAPDPGMPLIRPRAA